MDTKDIALFLTIARVGSISRTAEQLFMSQSTVTTRLQRLERELGYTLFTRLPNGVRLTKDGERLIPAAERMTALESVMLNPDSVQAPVLRVMSGRAFVSTDVPACLTIMLKRSNVHLQVRMGLYEEMLHALTMHEVDFCFLGEPIYHPRIRQLEFAPDTIDLVVPKHHPFAENFPGLFALNREPFIAFGRSDAPFRERVMKQLAHENVFPDIRMELDSIDGVKAMVGHGLGVSFLPRRTLSDAKSMGCQVIPLNDREWSRPTLLCYPDIIENQPLTNQFIDVVGSYYNTLKERESRP
ncbi:LysR family transcriptional regulator [Alicyclobacillus tolerans]|uniref:LysR family transcriptional regulator n=1 Tax=Alicyclobacillus tolerans TaxID=90970 RepID=UPI001F1B6DA7|nr:LysR family transcriptional regulator [Alicyclobacillus tolerans]MCF8564027.1 LysR family transcriptional regulator [Alicyclobacillus tolerans]